jgi:membrane-associated protease RseP (regulator of RpoE activity)
MHWLILLLLGTTLYLIVQYRVKQITTAPVWLLWVVLMIPAFLMTIWATIYGPKEEMPRGMLIFSFVSSTLLYIMLVNRNRRQPQPEKPESAATTAPTEALPSAESTRPEIKPSPVRPITPEEESKLQGCFPWSIYYLQNIDYRPQAVLLKGQLRATPELAYDTIKSNVSELFGDRFLLIFQSAGQDHPYFILVPNPQAHRNGIAPPQTFRPGLALTLLLATLFTTCAAGLELAQPDLDSKTLWANPQLLSNGLPYALTLMLILGVHELGHFFTARHYRLQASPPYFIPLPFSFGTFGAFVQINSPMPDRKVLFDVGIAGPFAGLVITLPALIWGLMHSKLLTVAAGSQLLPTEAFDPKSSILFWLISKVVFGNALGLEQSIVMHPVAIAGGLGLVVTALNLMPIGQLDGGHIIHAMIGQRGAIRVGYICRFLVLFLAWIQPIFLLWAIFLFLMPLISQPALNDVSELDNYRDILGLLALALLLLIILPIPLSVANLLALTYPLPQGMALALFSNL